MIETKNWAVAEAIREAVLQTYSPYLDSDTVAQLASQFAVDHLGDGASCFVLALKTDTDWVAAPNYRDISPKEALILYHTHRLLNLLFPYNFPRLRFSSGKHPQKGLGILLRSRPTCPNTVSTSRKRTLFIILSAVCVRFARTFASKSKIN